MLTKQQKEKKKVHVNVGISAINSTHWHAHAKYFNNTDDEVLIFINLVNMRAIHSEFVFSLGTQENICWCEQIMHELIYQNAMIFVHLLVNDVSLSK